MKSVRLHRVGQLHVDDMPMPDTGPGQVLMRVGAVGVCGSDLPHVMQSGAHRMPVTIGHESAILVGISHDDLHLPEKAVERIMRHELSVTGSWNSNSQPYPSREWQLSVDYFGSGQLRGAALISHRLTLDKAPEVFPRLYRREMSFNKVLFLP